MSAAYRALELRRFAKTLREAADIVDLPARAPAPGEVAVRHRRRAADIEGEEHLQRRVVDKVGGQRPADRPAGDQHAQRGGVELVARGRRRVAPPQPRIGAGTAFFHHRETP